MKNYLSGLNAEFLSYLKFVLDPSSLCRNFRFRQTAHCATYRTWNPPPARDPGEPPPTRSNLACRRTPAVLAVILRTPPISHIRTARTSSSRAMGTFRQRMVAIATVLAVFAAAPSVSRSVSTYYFIMTILNRSI